MANIELNVLDFEEIWNMARDLIFNIMAEGMFLDDEGNYVGCPEDIGAFRAKVNDDSRFKYLNFRECEELRQLAFSDAFDLFTDEIREKYLYDTLPFIRIVMRKGSLTPGLSVADEVPDEYLDQIICTAWKSDLLIWCNNWDREKKL